MFLRETAWADQRRLWTCAAMVLLACAMTACGDKSPRTSTPSQPSKPEALLGGRPMSEFFIEHDRFASVTDPATVKPAQASFLDPDDEVYGVVIRGKARAYPVRMIAYYHVVNDQIADIPIAVTY